MDLPVLLRMALALGLVLGLIYGSVWLFRRFGPLKMFPARTREFTFDIVGQTHLGPKRSLMAVRVSGRTILLGLTPTAINFLTELEGSPLPGAAAATPGAVAASAPESPAHPATGAAPFGEELAMALSGLDRSRARLSGENVR